MNPKWTVSTHIQNQMKMSGRLLLITVSCFAALAKAGNIAEELTAAGKDFWYAARNAAQKCLI